MQSKLKSGVLLLCLLLFTSTAQLLPAVDVYQDIINSARRHIGSAYCNGSSAPPCFDCSGFVYYLFSPHVEGIPRVSRQMARSGRPIQKSDLQPGDLVFFATSPAAGVISHVALYIGQNSIIHAISDGPNRGVNLTPLDARYWRSHYHSAVRILPDSATAPTSAEEIEFAYGTYSGELENGEPHGQGTLILDNGDVYRGRFSRGEFHGTGTYIWKNGERFEGSFEQGVFHGAGVYIKRDGTQFSGVWQNGNLVERTSEPTNEPASAGSAGPASTDGAESAGTPEPLYTEKSVSPWDDWDGYVMGDYSAWKAQEEQSFEEWKRQNSPSRN